MPQISLQQWSKTPEGIEMIESQKIFCFAGDLWQGSKQCAFRTDEKLLMTEEFERIVDVDDSMPKMWFRRRQRIEGRLDRKKREYNKRRRELREERTSIRTSMKEDKELKIAPSPDDLAQIAEIDARQTRLRDLAGEQDLEKARIGMGDTPPEPEPEPPQDPGAYCCDGCGKDCPRDHKNPERWLRGHKITCKGRKAA